MKTRCQRVWLTAIAIAGSVALYGCGGGSSPDTTPFDQAAVDQAAADAAAAAKTAAEARVAAIAAAQAAAADAKKAAMDAADAEMAADAAATMADNNAMATSYDVDAATTASGAAATASSDAVAAATAAAAASARAAAVDHADPAVTAAKTAAAADAAAARMSAENAAASAMAAADSVTVATQLQAQAEADAMQAMTDAENARMAGEYSQSAQVAAGMAMNIAEMAKMYAREVMDGDEAPDTDRASGYLASAEDAIEAAQAASDMAMAISAEGNPAVATAQMDAADAVDNARMYTDQVYGAGIAVSAYSSRNMVVGASQDVMNADAAIERLKSIVSWIVSADDADVMSAQDNASAAAHLAPLLAGDALAEASDENPRGGGYSDITTVRRGQMTDHYNENMALRSTVEEVLADAAEDYDIAAPTYENGKMNPAGAMVEDVGDLATGGIVKTGSEGMSSDAYMVNSLMLESADTIVARARLDFIGDTRVVTTGGLNSDNTRYTTEIIEYDRWSVGNTYEYIRFGTWAVRDDGFLASNLNAATDKAGSMSSGVSDGATIQEISGAGAFVFADRGSAWDSSQQNGAAATARYDGAHSTVFHRVPDSGMSQGRTYSGSATITVDFDTNMVDATFEERDPTDGESAQLYSIQNMVLDGSSLMRGEDTDVSVNTDSTGDPTGNPTFPLNFATAPANFALSGVAGGLYGPNAEEIAGSVAISGRNDADDATLSAYTAFGGRHQSHQE